MCTNYLIGRGSPYEDCGEGDEVTEQVRLALQNTRVAASVEWSEGMVYESVGARQVYSNTNQDNTKEKELPWVGLEPTTLC